MVQVGADVQGHARGGGGRSPVVVSELRLGLREAVPRHGRRGDVQVAEEVRGGGLAGVAEAEGAHERGWRVVAAGREEQVPGGAVQVVPRGARVGELGVAALARGREGDGAEEGVGGAPGVEAAVGVLVTKARGGPNGVRQNLTRRREEGNVGEETLGVGEGGGEWRQERD